MHRGVGPLQLAMPQLELRVRAMAIITALEGRARVLPIVMVRGARSRIGQDETHQVVVRVRLRIPFNGIEESWFLLRKSFFMIVSAGSVLRAFRPSGLVIWRALHFSPSAFPDSLVSFNNPCILRSVHT